MFKTKNKKKPTKIFLFYTSFKKNTQIQFSKF